jgi:prepilin-type N-terminal cleavage/methylation domain-containing protein
MIRAAARRCRDRSGMTLIELCVVIGIIGILFGLAVASLKRAKLAANEADALGALRTITKAQFAYAVNCGRGSYATSLLTLGAKTSSRLQGFLNEDLGSSETVTRDGYTVHVQIGLGAEPGLPDCMGRDTYTSYYATAYPVELGKTGTRAFATNQGGAIWQRLAALPPPEPFGPPTSEVAR